MLKLKAIDLLGGTVNSVAEAVGVSPSAVSQWPDVLPPRIADRVLAALARKHLPPEMLGEASPPPPPPGPAGQPTEAHA